MWCLCYYYILYYIIHILLYYILLSYILYSSVLSSLPLFYSFPSFSSQYSPHPLIHLLFYSSLYNPLLLIYLLFFPIYLLYSSTSPHPILSFQYSFYTCRYLHTVIYIISLKNNLTPHKLSEGCLEWCSFISIWFWCSVSCWWMVEV